MGTIKHWLKLLAARILQGEMSNLRDALSAFAEDNARLAKQRDDARGKFNRIRKINKHLSEWAGELAEKADGGETQSRMLFIRDMLDHGPEGPYANSHGVHPAKRWNIQSYKEKYDV